LPSPIRIGPRYWRSRRRHNLKLLIGAPIALCLALGFVPDSCVSGLPSSYTDMSTSDLREAFDCIDTVANPEQFIVQSGVGVLVQMDGLYELAKRSDKIGQRARIRMAHIKKKISEYK